MSDPAAPCYVPLGAVEIRTARPEEYPTVGRLARLIWHASFRSFITAAQIDYMLAWRNSPEAMAEAVHERGLTYEILRVDGEPLGYLAHGPTGQPGEYKLNQLYVHPDWQGRGLGRRLLDHVEARARHLGYASLVLTVNRRNHRARALYEKHGFHVRESVVVDIGGGFVMDDHVMVKPLAG